MLLKLNRFLTKVSIFLITAALIAGMAGCDGCGYNPPPSQNLEIRTWYDLNAVRDNLAGNHTLINDLDSTTVGYAELASPTANGGKGWQPIGFYTPHGPTCCEGLWGTFDGQGYEIRDLFIDRPDEDGVGLFKYVERYYGIIKDIDVTNVTVIGRNGVGGLVGGNGGTVSNCYCSGEVTGNDDVGGLAGSGNGVVIDSCFTGSVAGYEYVGGLVGYNHCDVSRSHFAGNVTGSSYVGGLVGANHHATVSDSYCSGSVTGYEHVGGLVGYISRSTVSNSYSTASVSGEVGVGGLVGDSYEFDVSNSYYDYDEVLINGENIISIGALFGEDFDQWLANDRFLDVDERLSQENGYYLINDVTDFKQLLAFGQNANLKFRLTSDLNLATEPGLYIPYLTGEFDGNGHKISNLSFNFDFVCYVGLFGYLAPGGEVSQVGVENINITGAGFVGGLVGQSRGNVSNCYSTGSVTGKEWYVGGLVGWNVGSNVNGNVECTVSNSYSTASVSGGDIAGGLVGRNCGGVSDSYSTGSVIGYEYVGGLVGWNRRGVSDSYSTGSVTGYEYVGGLVGDNHPDFAWLPDVDVSNSYYNYDEVLINGENIITIGALSGEDFDQWLDNDKFLDVNGRLSQEDGYYLINDVDDLKQLLAFGQNATLKFRLANDLNLATETNFYIPYLAGEFDGNGHKISNLSFNFDFVSCVGLFGCLALGGNVTNLAVEDINITGRAAVGGLVGLSGGSVSNCYSTGSVTGETSPVGGLTGYNVGTMNSSYSTASVTGDERVGGLVGWNDFGRITDGIISNSYATGSVTGNWGVGGLVGQNSGTMSNSYSTGKVTGLDNVGGLVGNRGGIETNSFWDRQTSGRSFSGGGTRKTTAQMKNIATFLDAGWKIVAVSDSSERNHSYIWNIVDGVTYPFLSWQP